MHHLPARLRCLHTYSHAYKYPNAYTDGDRNPHADMDDDSDHYAHAHGNTGSHSYVNTKPDFRANFHQHGGANRYVDPANGRANYRVDNSTYHAADCRTYYPTPVALQAAQNEGGCHAALLRIRDQ